MPVTWELSKGIIRSVDRAESQLRDFVTEERQWLENMTEDWLGSDEGLEVQHWLEILSEAADMLSEVRQVPG